MSTKKTVKRKSTAAPAQRSQRSAAMAAARRSAYSEQGDRPEVHRQNLEEMKRRHEKRKRKRRRRRRIILIIFVVLLLCAGIFCLVFLTPFFLVKEVAYYGYERVSVEEIETAAAVPVGENTFKLKMSDIEKRVETLPYVKEARVRRKLPDCINIMVFEREIFAYVTFAGSWYAVDEEGYVLEQFAACPEDHVALSGLSVVTAAVGEKLEFGENGEDAFSAAKEIVGTAQQQEILENISNLDVSDLSNITFIYGGKYTVKFGSHLDAEQKMIYLKNVVSDGSVQMASSGSIQFDIDAGKAFFAYGE